MYSTLRAAVSTAVLLLFTFLVMVPSPAMAADKRGESPERANEGAQSKDKVTPNFFDVPAEEMLRLQLWESEIKSIQYEAKDAIQTRLRKKEALLAKWRKEFNIKDFKGWEMDTNSNRLNRIKEK